MGHSHTFGTSPGTPLSSLNSVIDSLESFPFDCLSFEARESRKALADIGMPEASHPTRKTSGRPDKHRFTALSEPVHRALVINGFLQRGNRLNPETQQSNYTASEYNVSDIPRFFDQQVGDTFAVHCIHY